MTNRKSLASILIFVGSTLCFFLPLVTVSCGGVTAFTLTGIQLATGTTIHQPQAFGPPQRQKIDADPLAALAVLCALGGVALSLIGRRLAAATAISGGVGAASLLVMRSRLDDQLQKQAGGMASANFETGFTLAVLLLIAGAAWNAYLFLQNRRSSDLAPGAPDQTGGSGGRAAPRSPTAHTSLHGEDHSTPSSDLNVQSQFAIGQGTSNALVCSQCGQAIGATARFCETCGSPAEMPVVTTEIKASS